MFKIILALYLILSPIFLTAKNPNFEYSGVEQFWKIVKIFEANLEPKKSDWDRLFLTPGYKILTDREFTRDFFEDNFRLVFKPNKKKDLEKKLKSGENIHHLNHYIKIRDNKRLINDQLKKLKFESYNNIAVNRTLEYLPQYSVSQFPPVSFVFFESNGRGSSPIIVDLAASIEWDFVSFLAHEYHHWYRNRQLKFRLERVDLDERDIVNALSLIEAEGIADMVDKRDWYEKPNSAISDYAKLFLRDVRRTPHVIKMVDQLFIEIDRKPKDKRVLGKKIWRNLPQRGHTTGYFMARVILENENKRNLINCVGNPFEFVLLYNDAAKKSGGRYPSFSESSIKYIKELSKKYSI